MKLEERYEQRRSQNVRKPHSQKQSTIKIEKREAQLEQDNLKKHKNIQNVSATP